MSNVIWKAFKFKDIFKLDGSYNAKISNKFLDVAETKTKTHSLLLINKGGIKNAEEGYINKNNKYKVCSNGITMDDQFGNCFYHDTEFIMTGGGHINVLLFKEEKLEELANKNKIIYYFVSIMLRKVFNKSDIYGYIYKITGERPNREIIFFPVLEVNNTENYIWEENRKYWTLAIDYITEIMKKAKELKEQKTIKFYEAEKKRYEAEKKRYEAGYHKEQTSLVWKAFKLGDLFDWSSRKDLALKKYNKITNYMTEYVEVITGSKTTINDYIKISDLPINYPIYSNCLTLNTNGSIGHCFYYPDEIISPTSSVHILIHKEEKLKKVFTKEINSYFAKVITYVFTSQPFGYTHLIDKDNFDKQFILLPTLEVNDTEDYIWEENRKFWTLALNTTSYLYIQGQINNCQHKISAYTYKY
jgi:hypothetical protein